MLSTTAFKKDSGYNKEIPGLTPAFFSALDGTLKPCALKINLFEQGGQNALSHTCRSPHFNLVRNT